MRELRRFSPFFLCSPPHHVSDELKRRLSRCDSQGFLPVRFVRQELAAANLHTKSPQSPRTYKEQQHRQSGTNDAYNYWKIRSTANVSISLYCTFLCAPNVLGGSRRHPLVRIIGGHVVLSSLPSVHCRRRRRRRCPRSRRRRHRRCRHERQRLRAKNAGPIVF